MKFSGLTILVLSLTIVFAASQASAEVKTAKDSGFALKISVDVNAAPKTVYRHFVDDVSKWWDKTHTFSGQAANLSIDARAGGMFHEKLPDGGSVRHMQVLNVMPGRLIRMSGGLGPMQTLAVSAVMTVRFVKKADGTQVQVTYNVGGFAEGGLKRWASPVNGVIFQQFKRLKAFVEQQSK